MRASDQEILRRFEPLLRFTRGEKFFPIDTQPYVQECSLWVQHPGKPAERLIAEQDLTLEELGRQRPTGFGSVHFLQFIEPLNLVELAAYLVEKTFKKQDPQDVFRAGRGRLSRVGYTSRFMDALFSLSLLARGRVPGDRALAAAITYQQMRAANSYRYHVRIVRQSGWVVLQYWYFYVYNDWRSGYYGANDHEADWEMVNIYLCETLDGILHPEWVAYASHDFAGDDLRRHWDDPEMEKVGEHPVVYAAAGSHASYYSAGDYLTEIEVPFLSPAARVLGTIQKFIRRWLRHNVGEELEFSSSPSRGAFRIPFVDYARGDGFSIGEGGDVHWDEPVLLEPAPAWVQNYRGLWGYYARDPVSGENAPSGARYTRDGKVRRAWHDPVGWAGLDKVPPHKDLLLFVIQRQAEIHAECNVLEHQIAQKQQNLYDLGVEANAMRDLPHLRGTYHLHQEQMDDLSDELCDLRARLSENKTMLDVLSDYESDLKQGRREPLRGHLQYPHRPEKESALRLGWLAEIWSAISIGLLLIISFGVAIFARQYLYISLAAIFVLIFLIEAGFRRKLSTWLNTVAIILAVISFVMLLIEYFWLIVILIVCVAGLYMIWQNLRELWS